MYKLTNNNTITRIPDNACIPMDTGNTDYQAYLAWLADGNIPEPADLPAPSDLEAQRILSLWQAATAYEQSFIANMAIGLLTMGVMLQKPKALAISEWSSDLWNGPDGYYARKSNGSTNYDYSNIGPMPYTIPELSAEVLG